MITKPLVTIVCPFFNEAQTAHLFYKALTAEIQRLDQYEFEVICVDDGSQDDTLTLLLSIAHAVGRKHFKLKQWV